MNEPEVLVRVRRLLLATFGVGAIGMVLELLFLGHFESRWELVPLVLLAASVIALVWQASAPGRASVRAFQATMVLFVVSGGLGIGLHYDSNVEFELELYPSMSGLELIGKTLTGAVPVLAPGTMALLGLVGLASAYRHPCLIEKGDE